MKKIFDFLKGDWMWLHIVISMLVVVAAAGICIAISGPDTAIGAGLGVWINLAFIVEVFTAVAYRNLKMAGRGLGCDVIGALLGCLVAIIVYPGVWESLKEAFAAVAG